MSGRLRKAVIPLNLGWAAAVRRGEVLVAVCNHIHMVRATAMECARTLRRRVAEAEAARAAESEGR